ncbi:MAG TPA: cupin domain-containing protein [Bryobacteraceae bacterium]|nr:cupin domain-containing protein [Bryobacteraceae bacterium]
MVIKHVAARAEFPAGKMGKVRLAAGEFLYAGLNCFAPGQAHHAHTHPDQDKLYYVIEGRGDAVLGDEITPVEPGDLVLAPAGVPHGMANTGDVPLVVLTLFAPPPKAK